MTQDQLFSNSDSLDLDALFGEIEVGSNTSAATTATVAATSDDNSIDLELLEGMDNLLNLDDETTVEPAVTTEPAKEAVKEEPAKEAAVPSDEFLDGLLDSELDLISPDELAAFESEVQLANKEESVKKAPVKKAKKAEKPTVKSEEDGEEDKKVVSPTTARTTYHNAKKSDVLLDRLGGSQDDIVLEFSDADLSPEELADKQREFLQVLNIQPHMSTTGVSTQKKVAEKVVILFTYLKRGGKMNEVIYRTIKLLVEEGKVTSGDNGNLVKSLLDKPYSKGTARAQSGQMFKLLPLLKIAKEDSKGVFVANEDSVILRRLRDELFPANEESAA
ncbi:hypothetical protein [Acinetobacter brisouii]|uniref:hypothetical protein n=1 Tax=Acinetobacter brisouii TaxID=396323 RepID=UPI00124C35DA|nr:hypothetical protein [Acinetobacter brisouii]